MESSAPNSPAPNSPFGFGPKVKSLLDTIQIADQTHHNELGLPITLDPDKILDMT